MSKKDLQEHLKRTEPYRRSRRNSIDALVSENGRLDRKIESLRVKNGALTRALEAADRLADTCTEYKSNRERGVTTLVYSWTALDAYIKASSATRGEDGDG